MYFVFKVLDWLRLCFFLILLGFIILDCGLLFDGFLYIDLFIGLIFILDISFVESGKNGWVDKDFERNFEKVFVMLRYFLEG